MSKQKKTDLLVRVRYINQLPPPPFPPRLLNITTTPQRYSSYEFLNPLIAERELPMVLDSELGMPLELGHVPVGEYGDGAYWEGKRDAICPKGPPTARLDPEDAFLMDSNFAAVPGTLAAGGSGSVIVLPGGSSNAGGERKKLDVSWLRRTEYLSSEGGKAMAGANSAPVTQVPVIALDKESRATAISSTFVVAAAPLADLRHPTKKHLRATQAWNVMPDEAMWAHELNLVRFGEDPGEGKVGEGLSRSGADPRLPRAIFRNVEIPGDDARIGYYLPTDVETAVAYETKRLSMPQNVPLLPVENDTSYEFRFIRDYEIASTRPLKSEYVFTFEDAPEGGLLKRARGAYYAEVAAASLLRKRRPRRNEDPTAFPAELEEQGIQFWNGISVTVAGSEVVEEEEQQTRAAKEALMSGPPAAAPLSL